MARKAAGGPGAGKAALVASRRGGSGQGAGSPGAAALSLLAQGPAGQVVAPPPPSAKTLEEVEASILASKRGASPPQPARAGRAGGKQPVSAKGHHCEVKKHSEMGCATVTLTAELAREVDLMQHLRQEREKQGMAHIDERAEGQEDREKHCKIQVGEHQVDVRPHQDKDGQVRTDVLFLAWGRKVEKESPVSAESLAEAMDQLYLEALQARGNSGLPLPAMPASPVSLAASISGPSGFFEGAYYNEWMAQQQAMMAGYYQPMMWMEQEAYGQPAGELPSEAPVAAADAADAAAEPAQGDASASGEQGAAEGPPQTPPRQINSTASDDTSYLTPPPPVQSQMDWYGGMGYYNTPEKKALAIVDPKSGQPIAVDRPSPPPAQGRPTQPNRKPMQIVDPRTGVSLDPMRLIFEPARRSDLSLSIKTQLEASAN